MIQFKEKSQSQASQDRLIPFCHLMPHVLSCVPTHCWSRSYEEGHGSVIRNRHMKIGLHPVPAPAPKECRRLCTLGW